MRSFRFAIAALVLLAAACGGARPRDAAGDRPGFGRASRDGGEAPAKTVPEPPRVAASPTANGTRARVFVKAAARALATDASRLYYGDTVDDGLFAIAKAGGEPTRLARRAPVSPTLALDGDAIVWVASPGDAVLRAPLAGGATPTVLRERGIFQDVAAHGSDVFITEALGAGGALLRVTGPTASRIATFDGAPRGVVADGSHAYVVTPTKLLRAPYAKGEVETLASGSGFDAPVLAGDAIYVLAEDRENHTNRPRVVAVAKSGGAPRTVARDVRDAPFAVAGGEILYFDAARPRLLAAPVTGGAPRVLAEDDAFQAPTAVVSDDTTVFVATGARESGAIFTIPRR